MDAAELVLTEIKAAAIDVVAEEAERRGLPVVFVDNVPLEVAPAESGALGRLAAEMAALAGRRHEARFESGRVRRVQVKETDERDGLPPESQILVVDEGHAVPFSKGLLAQSLTATGLSPERAYAVAREVELHVRSEGAARSASTTCMPWWGRCCRAPRETCSVSATRNGSGWRCRTDRSSSSSEGATGVGKSTIATQLAHRLGIVRIISTDAVRQVMRAFFSDG